MLDETAGYVDNSGSLTNTGTPTGASAPAVVVPTGGGGGGGGGSVFIPPDYASLIASSPYVIAARAAAAQQIAALKAQMGASASRALINLGDASLAGEVGDLGLPGQTGKLVNEANTSGTSILSRLGHQHDLNQESIPAQLAGRGFYRSGQTGYALGEETRRFGNQQSDARSQTLDYLNNLYTNFLNSQFGINQSVMSAEFSAYQAALAQAAALAGPSISAPAEAPAVAPATSAYGYDASGAPVDFSNVPGYDANGNWLPGGYGG